MTWLLEFILGWILKYLAEKASNAVIEKSKELARDVERGEVNEANVKKYEEAVGEKERIDAALGLLNRNRP